MLKVIFFDGVDGAGKTTWAKSLLKTQKFPLKYFRSSYQINSKFGGRKIDLEESLKHDWRILTDFIKQTGDGIYLMDRSPLSSYVYGKVLRGKDTRRWLLSHLHNLKNISEFWIFIRLDENKMSEEEKRINESFVFLSQLLKNHGYVVKIFEKDSARITTTDFLKLEEEISSGRFDKEYYDEWLDAIINDRNTYHKNGGVIIFDIDKTLIDKNEKFRDEVLNSFKYNNSIFAIITGREKLDENLQDLICRKIGKRNSKFFILNDHNLGKSSRVLKEFFVRGLEDNKIPFVIIDDRSAVMKHIQKDGIEYHEDLAVYSYGRSLY